MVAGVKRDRDMAAAVEASAPAVARPLAKRVRTGEFIKNMGLVALE